MGSALYRSNYPDYGLDMKMGLYNTRGNLLAAPNPYPSQSMPTSQLPCHYSVGRGRGIALQRESKSTATCIQTVK